MDLHNNIVAFLKALPNIHATSERQALVYSASLDGALEEQIEFEGPSGRFCQLLVKTLWKYGILTDGRSALDAMLEAAQQRVGQNKQRECDTLREALRSLPEEQRQQFTRSLQSSRNLPPLIRYALLGILACCLGGGGFWWYFTRTAPFSMTIYLRDQQETIVLKNEGNVILELGGGPQERRIGAYGEAYFEQIGPKFRNQPVSMTLDAEGFELVYPEKQYVLAGDSITVEIKPNDDLAIVFGTIVDDELNGLEGVRVSIGDVHRITDQDGAFEFRVPLDKQTRQYALSASKPGYASKKVSSVLPGHKIELVLEK